MAEETRSGKWTAARNFCSPATLEIVLHTELNLTWIVWSITCRRDLSKSGGCCKSKQPWLAEVGCVGDIEDLCAEFKVGFMHKPEAPEEGEIEPAEWWPAYLRTGAAEIGNRSRCACRYCRRIRKRIRVDIRIHIVWPAV